MLLEARNPVFQYGDGPRVLSGVSIALKSGEVVGITGPSGCGKTTLGRILAGYLKPLEGSVLLDGSPLPQRGYSPVQLVYQHPEKVVNTRWRMGSILKEGWDPPPQLLESLGIEKEWLKRWPNELSGGELQRFCVARALSPDTKFLIADEMTTMLDAITQAQIWNTVLEVANKNKMGLLVVSHERSLLMRICSRIVDMGN